MNNVLVLCRVLLLQERADEGAIAPVARDASPRGGRVVEEPGVQEPGAKNVSVVTLSAVP